MEFLPQGAFPGSVPACFQKADEDKTVGGLFVCPPPPLIICFLVVPF